jgi:hypothetical protein
MKFIVYLVMGFLSHMAVASSGGTEKLSSARAEAYTYAMVDFKKCDISRIPEATHAAVVAAVNEASKTCTHPEIMAARILSVEPIECDTWTARFVAKAEVEFKCAQ